MRLRTTTPASITFTAKSLLVVSVLTIAFAVPIQLSTTVFADKYDDQINALKQDVEKYQAETARLSGEARTLQSALATLAVGKAQIQAQLDMSQAKYDKLVSDIADTKLKIKNNQDALGETIAHLYVDDKISPLEMIASSKNVSEYLDKQEYRNSVRDELTSTIAEIKALKAELDVQKIEVERILADQKTQRDALVAKENEQQALLDKTKGEEAAYQNLTSQKNSEIQKIQAEQATYFLSIRPSSGNVSAGDPNKGGYPTYLAQSDYYNAVVDPWGMFSRQCVSYTAWKVQQAYGNMPYWGGIGNAWQWAFSGWQNSRGERVFYNSGNWHTANTVSRSVPAGSEPKVGSVAVLNATPGNPYGHVAWVEAVMGNEIRISQYNYYNAGGQGWGHYSEMTVNKSYFQQYIYFGER